MVNSLREGFFLAALACFLPLFASAQTQPPPPSPAKGTGPDTTKPAAKDTRPTLDKMRFPPGGIPVIVEDIKDALASFPKWILLKPEEYQQLLDRVGSLERQLKEKNTPFACKLSGKLHEDQLHLQAEYLFATSQPKSTIVLGLQGAHLVDEGELDRHAPLLDYTDEGYVVRVESPGTHQMTLNLRVPVGLKKASPVAVGVERSVELGLPGAAVTTLTLELSRGVKELRWNETLEKARPVGRWDLVLGKIKNLSLSWKEPVAIPGSGPLLVSDAQIAVKLEETFALTTAELALEDLRGQTKEWHLLLPAQAKVEQIKAPGNAAFEHVLPDAKNSTHVIRLKEPTSERVLVSVKVWTPRPFVPARLPVGPFLAVGPTRHQQGTIVVKTTPEALGGQRLLYHRHGETLQRDPNSATDTVATFQYAVTGPVLAKPKSAIKAAVELELKAEKGQVEARVDHVLDIRSSTEGWQIGTRTHIKVTPLHGAVDHLDVQLPRQRPEGPIFLGGATATGFPAGVPWAALMLGAARAWPVVVPPEYVCLGEAGAPQPELLPLDPVTRRVRIKFNRLLAKEFAVTLHGKYALPFWMQAVALEVPKPLVFLDRGATVAATVEDGWELLVSPSPARFSRERQTPAPEGQQRTWTTQQAPATVELGWRPYQPELPVKAVTEVTLHEQVANVRHEMTWATMPKSAEKGGIWLRVPPAARNVSVNVSGRYQSLKMDKGSAWVALAGDARTESLTLKYDFVLPPAGSEPARTRTFSVPLIWPESATHLEAVVRVWSEPGTLPALADARVVDAWEDQAPRPVQGYDAMPALLLQGAGAQLPLVLKVQESPLTPLARAILDRGLVQVAVDEDGGQHYRARFLVRKFHQKVLEIEVPRGAEGLSIAVDNPKVTKWSKHEADGNSIIRFEVDAEYYSQPVLLEIDYTRPGAHLAVERFWQTTLHPPRFRSEVFLGKVRWQLSLPASWTPMVPEGQTVDARWGLQGWLLSPLAEVSSSDLEHWLTGKESADPPSPVSLALWRNSLEPLLVLHLPRQAWLLICSGLFLAVGLGLFFAPLSRFSFWLLVGLLGAGTITVACFWPTILAPLVLGCQPGLVVLLLILVVQWLLQERYRRQVVFMPGFTRLKPGSSLIRSGRQREASTVDAPPPSSVEGAAAGSSNKSGQN
jgi:hypothetical protein